MPIPMLILSACSVALASEKHRTASTVPRRERRRRAIATHVDADFVAFVEFLVAESSFGLQVPEFAT